MTKAGTLPPAYFRALYAADPDPWGFASSAYEQAKYQATLAALPRARFGRCFEVGCSIGVLTALLAGRSDTVLAVDVDPPTLDRARVACADHDNIVFQHGMIPAAWPEGRFDLIVLSEVLYYLSRADVAATADLAVDALDRGGCIVLVHWTGATDYPCGGDEAADLFVAAAPLTHRLIRHPAYRIDVLIRDAI
jgi:SAM-dependent methyltransferase